MRCKPNYRLKRPPLDPLEFAQTTTHPVDVVAAAPWKGWNRVDEDAIVFYCEYDLQSSAGVVSYLPLVSGNTQIATSPA
jgi:hypothetical protein